MQIPLLLTLNIFTSSSARSAVMPVLFLLTGPKMGFRPAGVTRCPDKRESWHAGPLPRANFQFIGAKMWEFSHQNCQNFESWPNLYLSLRGDSFAIFLRNSQRLYGIGSF